MRKPRTEEQKARRRELDRIRREKKRAEAAAAAKVAAKGLKEKVVIKKTKPEAKKPIAKKQVKKPVKNPVDAEIRVIACDPYHALFITLAQVFDIMDKLLSSKKVVRK